MNERIEELEITLLLEALYQRFHYDFRGYSRASIERRLAQLRARLGYRNYSAMLEGLLHDESVSPQVIAYLTVQVSEMFRDPSYFRALREEVVPHLRTYPSLKVWIAGCSSGEEPYSLAMLALEAVTASGKDVDVRVLASDLDPLVLERARQGRYPAAAVAALAPKLRETWFDRDGDGVRVKARLRETVSFRPLDLFSSPPPPHLDLLLCRNVMIYFSRELQQRLLRAFHQALRPGGIFVTGKTETVLGPARTVFQCVSARSRIFAKA